MLVFWMRMLQTGRRMAVVVAVQRDLYPVVMQIAVAELAQLTIHRDGCERLGREAQCKQNDDDEFAPVVHEGGV